MQALDALHFLVRGRNDVKTATLDAHILHTHYATSARDGVSPWSRSAHRSKTAAGSYCLPIHFTNSDGGVHSARKLATLACTNARYAPHLKTGSAFFMALSRDFHPRSSTAKILEISRREIFTPIKLLQMSDFF
jgi:hypothetical protein